MIKKKQKEAIEFFKDLKFDEEKHIYKVGNRRIKASASKLYGNFKKKFETNKIAYYVARKQGCSIEEVTKGWDNISKIACDLGTRVHLFGELYPFNKSMKPTCGHEEAAKKFWDDLPPHLEIFHLELKMYHKFFLFAGTGDIILYNKKTKKFWILDFKTNKDIFKNFKKQKMLGIFKHLLDMPYNHYQLQLSFYQILFEQLGYEVEKRKIVWLKPDGNYELYDTEDYTKELLEYLKSEGYEK